MITTFGFARHLILYHVQQFHLEFGVVRRWYNHVVSFTWPFIHCIFYVELAIELSNVLADFVQVNTSVYF